MIRIDPIINIDYDLSTTSGYWFDTKGGKVEHLNIEHPELLDRHIMALPKLKSITFKFEKSAFKKTFKEKEFIERFLKITKLERLTISGAKQLESIPQIIKDHPIRSLTITNCQKIKNFKEILNELTTLEELIINKEEIDWGNSFPYLPNLRRLSIGAKKVSSFEGISQSNQIDQMSFSNLEITTFPKELSDLNLLTKININNLRELKSLPSFHKTSHLLALHIYNLPKISKVDIDFTNAKNLQELYCSYLGDTETHFEFPENLCKCKNLKQLSFYNIGFTNIPEEISDLQHLESLTLYNLSISRLPNVFRHFQRLTRINIQKCLNLIEIPDSFGEAKSLKQLFLSDSPKVENIKIDFSQLTELEIISLVNLDQLSSIDESLAYNNSIYQIQFSDLPLLGNFPSLEFENKNLEKLEIKNCSTLMSLPESILKIPKLKSLILNNNGFKRLPEQIDQLTHLEILQVFGDQLEFMPIRTCLIPTLTNFNFSSRRYGPNKNDTINVQEAYKALQKIDSEAIKKAVMFWVGGAFEFLPLTEEIKIRSFEALDYSLKSFPLFIFSNIHKFNPSEQKVEIKHLQKGDKVWVNGNIQGGKTDFKKKLEGLGLKVVRKFIQDVHLIVIGKKCTVPDGLFSKERWFSSQLDIENISKVENPGMLQKEDVPENFLNNLQELLWSADPQNEAIALELVKSHGLPESIEEDFLLVAKFCKDKNLKNRIRTFLRGKISPTKQKALTAGSHPFHVRKLNKILPPESLAKMHFANFKRTKIAERDFFHMDMEAKHPRRFEIFEVAMQQFLSNVKYLNCSWPFEEHEWNIIFEQAVFRDNLNRVVINLSRCRRVPEKIQLHKDSLKNVQITVNDNFNLEGIYPLFKLNILHVNGNNILQVPKGLGNLKRLRTLYIYTSSQIKMPQDLVELQKLKNLRITKFSNRSEFVDKFPDLKF